MGLYVVLLKNMITIFIYYFIFAFEKYNQLIAYLCLNSFCWYYNHKQSKQMFMLQKHFENVQEKQQ